MSLNLVSFAASETSAIIAETVRFTRDIEDAVGDVKRSGTREELNALITVWSRFDSKCYQRLGHFPANGVGFLAALHCNLGAMFAEAGRAVDGRERTSRYATRAAFEEAAASFTF